MQRIQITNGAIGRESDSMATYLKEINRVGFLTADDECRLIKEYRAGNLTALEKIVKANLRFVVSVARRYQYQGISLSDLICEGNIGLIKAVGQYDETRGFKFISYAVWWIRESIIKALTENSRMIRLPHNKVASLNKLKKVFKKLEQEFEREPTFEELSNLSGIETEAIKTTMRYKVNHVSIDAPLALDEVKSLLDVIEDTNAELPDSDIVFNESLKTTVRFLFADLNKNQTEVVRMYYGIEGQEQMNLNEISIQLNVSSERIRQIKKEALNRIKKSKYSLLLKKHIGSYTV